MPLVLRTLGADPVAVFEAAGVDLHVLDDPEAEITFVAMGRLLRACVEATGCEHFGLLAGQRLAVRSLGAVGRLMRTAPTLEFALLDLALNQARNADGAVCYLRRAGEHAALCYAVYQPGTPAIEQISYGAMALAFNTIRELAGAVAVEVTFCHAEPRDRRPFQRFFGVPLQFDADESGVVVPSRALSRPLDSANMGERDRVQQIVRSHEALRSPDVAVQVRRLLRPRIVSGRPSLDQVAGYLALHPRTLLRRLNARGTTFRGLLNETRFEVACQLLAGTRLSVTHIGLALGYAETAVFSRAFARWSGLGPSAWRARHGARPPIQRTRGRAAAPPGATAAGTPAVRKNQAGRSFG